MKKYILFFIIALTVVFALPADANVDVQKPVPTTVKIAKPRDVPSEPVIPPAIMAKWAKVNICETNGNWHTRGAIYSGGLGILETNWMHYGGWIYGAEYAATPAEQVAIAIKIQETHGYANYVPDQNGCGHGW